jgi:hypothetical protein
MGTEASKLLTTIRVAAEEPKTWDVLQCAEQSADLADKRWVVAMSDDADVYWNGSRVSSIDLPIPLAPCLVLEAGTITHIPFTPDRFPDVKVVEVDAEASSFGAVVHLAKTVNPSFSASIDSVLRLYTISASNTIYMVFTITLAGLPLMTIWTRKGSQVTNGVNSLTGYDGHLVRCGEDTVYVSSATASVTLDRAHLVGVMLALQAGDTDLAKKFVGACYVLEPDLADFWLLVGEEATGLAYNATHAAFTGPTRVMVQMLFGVQDDLGFMDGVQVYTSPDTVVDLPCSILSALEFQKAIVLVLPRAPEGALQVYGYIKPKPEACTTGAAFKPAAVPLAIHTDGTTPLQRFLANPTVAFVVAAPV